MKIIIVIMTLLIFMSIVITSCSQEPTMSERSKLAYQISRGISEQLKNKYDLDFRGIGLSCSSDGKTLKTLKLNFSLTHLVTKEEGRDLILKCVEDFLHKINESKEIRPYLVQFPFTYKNIELVILFYSDARYEPTLDPNIWSISLVDGIINYKIADAQNLFINKSWEKESYDDVLKAS